MNLREMVKLLDRADETKDEKDEDAAIEAFVLWYRRDVLEIEDPPKREGAPNADPS